MLILSERPTAAAAVAVLENRKSEVVAFCRCLFFACFSKILKAECPRILLSNRVAFLEKAAAKNG